MIIFWDAGVLVSDAACYGVHKSALRLLRAYERGIGGCLVVLTDVGHVSEIHNAPSSWARAEFGYRVTWC